MCFFVVRDPVSRFISGFYSRKRQSQPLNLVPWSEQERRAFERFSHAEELVEALASGDTIANDAMANIRHLRYPMSDWLTSAQYLRERSADIAFIARQERLQEDWSRILQVLELQEAIPLPSDIHEANRSPTPLPELSSTATRFMRSWYQHDFEIFAGAELIRTKLIDDLEGSLTPNPSVAVGVVLFDQKGNVLLETAPYRRQPFIPGGACHPNEDPEMAAMRELSEELGINNLKLTLRLVDSSERQLGSNGVVHIWYSGRVSRQDFHPVPDMNEVTGWAWLTKPSARRALPNNFGHRLEAVIEAEQSNSIRVF